MHNIPLRIARLSRHASEGVQMLLETLAQDARFALRTLRLTPVFAATAVLTLGFGLGLNTMLFTLFNTYVLRPLAVSQPYSLYQLSFTTKGGRNGKNCRSGKHRSEAQCTQGEA